MKTVVVRNIRRADAAVVKRLDASTVYDACGRDGLMKPYLRPVKQLASGVLGLDMYDMREPVAKAGLIYLDNPEAD